MPLGSLLFCTVFVFRRVPPRYACGGTTAVPSIKEILHVLRSPLRGRRRVGSLQSLVETNTSYTTYGPDQSFGGPVPVDETGVEVRIRVIGESEVTHVPERVREGTRTS